MKTKGTATVKTRITELLGIEAPVVQGAMARIADASLAGAVSEAGGLGIIACRLSGWKSRCASPAR